MQHTHISLIYNLPGLFTDSALPYPTLPRGPPLATLAPTNIQLASICKVSVNQKPAKHFVTTRNPRNYDFVWCPDQIPTSNSKITSKSKTSPKHQNKHFNIQQFNNNKVMFCLMRLFDIYFDVLLSCWRMSLAKRSFVDYVGETQQVMFVVGVCFWKSDVLFCLFQHSCSKIRVIS